MNYIGDYVSISVYSTKWKPPKSERARGIQNSVKIMAYPYGHIRVLCMSKAWNNRRKKNRTTYQHISIEYIVELCSNSRCSFLFSHFYEVESFAHSQTHKSDWNT